MTSIAAEIDFCFTHEIYQCYFQKDKPTLIIPFFCIAYCCNEISKPPMPPYTWDELPQMRWSIHRSELLVGKKPPNKSRPSKFSPIGPIACITC